MSEYRRNHFADDADGGLRAAVDHFDEQTVHGLVGAQAARTPAAVAVQGVAESLTYRELEARANRLAHHLQRHGVGPDQRVGVCLNRGPDLVVALLGVLKAGGAYLPLDPAYPAERLTYMLADAEVRVLVTHGALPTGLAIPAGVSVVRLDAEAERLAGNPATAPTGAVTGEHLAYVIYTSGSTGRPKGVAIPHRAAVAFLAWATERFSAAELGGVLAATSVCFDLSVFELFGPLAVGGSSILADNVLALPTHLHAGRVTLLNTVPSALAELLRSGATLPTSIKTVNLAGEPLSRGLAERVYAQPGVTRVYNLYGPSEDTTYSTWELVARDSAEAPAIGRVIDGSWGYVLDAQLQPVPDGAVGELYLGGAGLARGYLGRPELTAERFIPDAWSSQPGARLYRTGDLVRLGGDGRLAYLGRADQQVKVRGFRIEPGEVEAALVAQDGVAEAVVTAYQPSDGPTELVAYLVPARQADDRRPSVGELRAALQARLPQYMVPTAFVWLASLPLTPNGKLDRRALPSPERERASTATAYAPPRTPTEALLAELWCDLLGLGRVGRDDSFFDLGGHSLLATRLLARARSAFGVELGFRAVFEAPTLSALADQIDQVQREGKPVQASPIRRAGRDDEPVISFAQARMWLLQALEPESAVYNVPFQVRLSGALDVATLRRSLQAIVQRHAALRASFPADNGTPRVRIAERVDLALPTVDLADLPDAERDAAVRHLTAEDSRRPFDLTHAPLLRARLLRLGATEHVLVLTFHHIVTDGWSLDVFLRELAALYEGAGDEGRGARGAEKGKECLAPLPIQYADFAAWQRDWLAGPLHEQQLDYWRGQLAGAPAALDLPADRPRPPRPSYRGAVTTFSLAGRLRHRLDSFARHEGATLSMALLAGFASLLTRYSRQDDLVIGSPVANRTRPETEGLIGFFVNTLPLRIDLAGQPTFRDLLGRARETTLGALAHQDLPFEQIVDAINPERDPSRHPIFQTVFSFVHAPSETIALSGLTLQAAEGFNGAAKFDLVLEVTDHGDRLLGRIEYSTDLFDASTIERLAGHLQTLLDGATADPDRPISDLPLLTEAERQSLLAISASPVALTDGRPAHERVALQAAHTPGAIAVADDRSELSYADLDRRANKLAHHLQRLGVGPEVLVGICLERSVDLVVAALGVLKAGGAYLPIDPSYPADRIAFTLDDARAPVLLTERSLRGRLPETAAHVLCLDADWPAVAAEPSDAPRTGADPDSLAYVIYTSGSTGRPKGVQISHRGLRNLIDWHLAAFDVTCTDRATQIASPAFDASVWEIWPHLVAGASVHIPSDDVRTSPARLRDWLVDNRITISFLPTPLAESVMALPWPAGAPLRTLLTGGDRLRAAPAADLPFTLVNNYGPTENTVVSTSGSVPPGADADPASAPSLGQPIANTRAYVLDGGLNLVPQGVPGELCVGGLSLARGYLNRPELTADRFVPDPFSGTPGERLYRTGDLVRGRPDGSFEFLGRLDHQVKIRGYRIELGEIEAVLRQHPAVQDCIVVARQDGPGGPRLAGYIVARADGTLTPAALQEHARERLPEYMVPAAIVLLDALPQTPNGKVDRSALPEPRRHETASDFVAPRGPVEETVARIWGEVLGVERISAHDSFFELGGHSLLASQVIARLRDALGVDLPLRRVFEAPTVAACARAIAELPRHDTPSSGPAITPIARSGHRMKLSALTVARPAARKG